MFEKIIVKIWFFLSKSKSIKTDKFPLEAKKIMVISNTALGDTILSTPAIKSLKKSFPEAHIIAILKSTYVPLFKDFNYIDEIIEYNGKYKGFVKTVLKIRKLNPDIVLILHSNGPQDIQLCVLGKCQFILKHPTQSKLKQYLSHDFKQKEQHNIEDKLDLVKFIAAKKIDTKMEIGKLDDAHYKLKYRQYKDFVGLQIAAADIYKMWPIEYFIELTKKILEHSRSNVLITGIQEEWELGEKIVHACGKRVVNLCGKCSIEELPYLIENLNILITNDTGTLHLAVALHTPTISLFSPTPAHRIGPYQDKKIHGVIQKDGSFIQSLPKDKRDNSAMQLIAVEEVFKLYEKLDQYIKNGDSK